MSEEQKNPQVQQASDGADAQNPGQKKRRRRPHHRGGKSNRPDANPAQPKEAAANAAISGEGRGQNSAKNENPQREGDANKPNKKRRNRHRNRKGGSRERGIEDLYGTPSENDALSLEELREKIVVRSADGSVPSAQHRQSEPDDEPVELPIPEEELFVSAPKFVSLKKTPEKELVEIVGVRFRHSGRSYYFDPKSVAVKKGDSVIVETTRGLEFGEVYFGKVPVEKNKTVSPLRPIIRIATEEDRQQNEKNLADEQAALPICRAKIAEHKLEMRLIDAEYAFDRSKLIFYFTAEGRVDFRELVRDLAGVFRTRIELRQIGIRDEARLIGGLAVCGRPLCCSSFLPDFAQVSIRMAKDQNIALNSGKISGICGRLMCCLRYEVESYAEELSRTPAVRSFVKTPDGVGTVVGNNPIAGTVRVLLRDGPETPKQYAREDVTVLEGEKNAPRA